METIKKIQISEEAFKNILKEELENACDFEWTGWRIPIYVDEETGELSSGSWLSNNSWQPDAIELPITIERWSMSDRGYEGDFTEEELEEGQDGYNQDDIDYEIDEMIDWYIDRMNEIDDPNYEFELV